MHFPLCRVHMQSHQSLVCVNKPLSYFGGGRPYTELVLVIRNPKAKVFPDACVLAIYWRESIMLLARLLKKKKKKKKKPV